ncbi:MAG TPA: prepilin-type N-terminal cleavage/methylation domain-containing protein [Candidatus Brocadiia bacterium]|nr:prepilin-type N-terminal cleavage/methylation domain-containing protein [Candidatus Brocadiia bacterium]
MRGTRSRGYTLIELMIVIGIMGVLSAITLMNVRKFYISDPLRKAVDDFRLMAIRARTLAVEGEADEVNLRIAQYMEAYYPTSPASWDPSFRYYYTVKVCGGYELRSDPADPSKPLFGDYKEIAGEREMRLPEGVVLCKRAELPRNPAWLPPPPGGMNYYCEEFDNGIALLNNREVLREETPNSTRVGTGLWTSPLADPTWARFDGLKIESLSQNTDQVILFPVVLPPVLRDNSGNIILKSTINIEYLLGDCFGWTDNTYAESVEKGWFEVWINDPNVVHAPGGLPDGFALTGVSHQLVGDDGTLSSIYTGNHTINLGDNLNYGFDYDASGYLKIYVLALRLRCDSGMSTGPMGMAAYIRRITFSVPSKIWNSTYLVCPFGATYLRNGFNPASYGVGPVADSARAYDYGTIYHRQVYKTAMTFRQNGGTGDLDGYVADVIRFSGDGFESQNPSEMASETSRVRIPFASGMPMTEDSRAMAEKLNR